MQNLLHKALQPKVLIFLMLLPFVLVMPLLVTTLIYGIPYPYFENNSKLERFEEVLESVELPMGVEVVSDTYSKFQAGFELSNRCSMFSGYIIKTAEPQKAFSQKFLENYQVEISLLTEAYATYPLVFDSKFKVIPIFLDEQFANEDTDLNLREDFDMQDFDLSSLEVTEDKEESLYIVYMINRDVFGSPDYRCDGKYGE